MILLVVMDPIYRMLGTKGLTPAQTRYPASKKEALCIYEVPQEYCDILYETKITIYTDHKNFTHQDMKSTKLVHWQLLIKEFYPTILFQKGEDNIIADQLSRLPMKEEKERQEAQTPKEILAKILMN